MKTTTYYYWFISAIGVIYYDEYEHFDDEAFQWQFNLQGSKGGNYLGYNDAPDFSKMVSA